MARIQRAFHHQTTTTMYHMLLLAIAFMLTLVILAQSPKAGLVAGFGDVYRIAGVKRTTHFLYRATWVLGGAFMLLCLMWG